MDELFPRHEEQLVSLMGALSEDEKQEVIELTKKLGLSIKNLSY